MLWAGLGCAALQLSPIPDQLPRSAPSSWLLADRGHPPHPLGQDAADRRFRHVSILRGPSFPALPFPAPAGGSPAAPLLLGRSEPLLHEMLLPAPGTFPGAAQSRSHLLIPLRAHRRAADLQLHQDESLKSSRGKAEGARFTNLAVGP